jgi:hypothetical protein
LPLPEIKHTKLVAFDQVSTVDEGTPFRLRGYVLSVVPSESDQPIYYCSTCRTKTSLEVCRCLTETDLRCPLTFTLWDGVSDSKDSVKTLLLPEDSMQSFFERLSFDQVKELLVHPYHSVELGVVQERGSLHLVQSRLVS